MRLKAVPVGGRDPLSAVGGHRRNGRRHVVWAVRAAGSSRTHNTTSQVETSSASFARTHTTDASNTNPDS